MKNMRIFLPEIFHFLVVKISIYLNRRVFLICGFQVFLDAFVALD